MFATFVVVPKEGGRVKDDVNSLQMGSEGGDIFHVPDDNIHRKIPELFCSLFAGTDESANVNAAGNEQSDEIIS